jgi:hypothetical protein
METSMSSHRRKSVTVPLWALNITHQLTACAIWFDALYIFWYGFCLGPDCEASLFRYSTPTALSSVGRYALSHRLNNSENRFYIPNWLPVLTAFLLVTPSEISRFHGSRPILNLPLRVSIVKLAHAPVAWLIVAVGLLYYYCGSPAKMVWALFITLQLLWGFQYVFLDCSLLSYLK